MIWLATPPWGRWAVSAAIVMLALWFELRPQSMVEHAFAAVDIAPGVAIGSENTTMRAVPDGLFAPIPPGATASRHIPAGNPVLAADTTGSDRTVPAGWWAVRVQMPPGARVGDRVLVVMLDRGEAVEGVVASAPEDDPFAGSEGTVALPANHAAAVAVASAEGRVAIMVSTG